MAIAISPCIDRTGDKTRDLGAEATADFTAALENSAAFHLDPASPYVLHCEVDNFLPGNAWERLLPGVGTADGAVAAMIIDERAEKILVIVHGDTRIDAGAPYTLGAGRYILDAAVKNATGRLAAWTRGAP